MEGAGVSCPEDESESLKKRDVCRSCPLNGVDGSAGKTPNVPLNGRLHGVSGICKDDNVGPDEFDRFRFDRRPSDMNAACSGFAIL